VSVLITSHNKTAGFFSNCSVRLAKIIDFFNSENKLPEHIDSSKQFRNYKENVDDQKEDLAKYFFEENQTKEVFSKCDYRVTFQFQRYKTLEFDKLNPFIETFFSPSLAITTIVESLEKKIFAKL
jgi:hypothetical protein